MTRYYSPSQHPDGGWYARAARERAEAESEAARRSDSPPISPVPASTFGAVAFSHSSHEY
jgi:hypothetical protein